MRILALFLTVVLLHFVLSVAGIIVGLSAAFDAQAGFWAAPGKVILVWTSAVLLSPLALLPNQGSFGYGEIAAVSVLFGVAAVGLARLWRAARKR